MVLGHECRLRIGAIVAEVPELVSPAAVELLGNRPIHIPYRADTLKDPDEPCRGVELVSINAMTSKGGARVVEVVPILPHGQ
jgi:hypothetical protein